MSAAVPHRQRLLRALGVTPLALRGASPAPIATQTALAEPAVPNSITPCVLVLPAAGSGDDRLRLDAAMQALGKVFAQAPCIEVINGELVSSIPPASAYLTFGEAQAHALGRSLSAEIMAAAEIVLLEEPATLREASGKRRLWQAIGGLRRHWRQRAAGEG